MKKLFLLLFIFCLTFAFAQEEELTELASATASKDLSSNSSDSILVSPSYYVADIFGFGEWNDANGSSPVMKNLKNDIQAAFTIPFQFSPLYRLSLTLADRFRIYGNFTQGSSDFDNGVTIPQPYSVDLRNRLYFEISNSLTLSKYFNFDFGAGMRFDSYASSNVNDVATGTPRDLSPQLLFYPFLSVNGKIENFSYNIYNFDAFYFNTGANEAFRFRDEIEMNLNLYLNYDLSSLITKDKNFGLGITAFMESYTYFTKGAGRTQAAKDKDLIAFTNFDADAFVLAEAKVKFFRPMGGLFMKTKNGSRVADQYVSDFFVGGDFGAIFEHNNFYFGVNYKGGKQVNKGTSIDYVPNKFVSETAVYIGFISGGGSPVEKLLVNQ